jgi:hypothetical protein
MDLIGITVITYDMDSSNDDVSDREVDLDQGRKKFFYIQNTGCKDKQKYTGTGT